MSAARRAAAMLCAALWLPGAAHAQPAQADRFLVDRWSTAEGLPVNGVNQVHVSPSGYLWLATFDGLVRFDGHRFTTYASSQDGGLPNNRLLQLEETADGLLWLLTDTGQLVVFDGRRFETLDTGDGLPDARLFALQAGPDGALWAHTWGGTARREGGVFAPLPRDPRVGLIGFVAHAPDGALWAASTTGVHRLDHGRATRSLGLADGVPEPTYYFAWDDSGRLWAPGDTFVARIDTDGRVVRVLDEGAKRAEADGDVVTLLADTTEFLVRGDAPPQRRERTREYAITMRERLLARAADGALWRNRIDSLERDGEVVFASPCKINHFAFDAVGATWVASSCEGLVRLRPRRIDTITAVAGKPLGSTYGLAQAADGTLWIATNSYGVAVVPPAGAPHWVVPPTPATGANTVWIGDDGETWIDACRLDADGRCTPPPDLPTAVGRGDAVRTLHRDRAGNFWVGGKALWQRTPDGSWQPLPAEAGLGDGESAQVRAITETRAGTLWFVTRGRGLLRRAPDGTLRRFDTADGLASNAIRATREDRSGQLWIATEDRGLCRMRDSTSSAPQIACIDRRRGLWSNSLHQVLFDDAERLWINSNHGVFMLPRAAIDAALDSGTGRVHPQVFTERDGLPDREGNGGVDDAGLRLADGRIAFPTVKGLVLFDPDRLRGDTVPARAVFEQLDLPDGRSLPAAARVDLPRGDRSLTLRYTGLVPTLTEPVYFRYRLLPDSAWSDLGDARQLSLTRLPPGEHVLELQAFGSSGEPGEAARMTLVLPSHWFETMAFHVALAVLIALLLAAWLLHLRRSALMRQHRLERTVAQRTDALRGALDTVSRQHAEIESLAASRTRFFANISHELRTPLALIAGPLRDAGDEGALDPQTRRLMRGNSERLERLVEQLLDLERIDAGRFPLHREPGDLCALVADTVQAFVPLARAQGIALATAQDARAGGLVFDADQIARVLGNLLSNALKFTPRGGRVDVSLDDAGDHVRLAVTDSGPGVPAEWQERIFDRFSQVGSDAVRSREGAGLGLSVCREIAQLHGGRLWVEDAPGGGARFVLVLPRGVDGSSATAPGATAARTHGATLPASDAPADDTPLATPPPADTDTPPPAGADAPARRRVLVAEDHPDLRAYIVSILQTDYDVVEAEDGEAALDLARTTLPDLVISDVMMPRRDGFALARALRAEPQTAGIPLIFLTARAGVGDEIEGLSSGADQYLRKPFDAALLRAHVAAAFNAMERLRRRLAADATTGGSAAAPAASPMPSGVADEADAKHDAADRRFLDAAHHWLRTHLHDEAASVAGMAAALHVSRATLGRRYTRLANESPATALRRVRLEHARQLLGSGAGNVSEVAYAVGYASLAAFSNAYREHFGHPPSRTG